MANSDITFTRIPTNGITLHVAQAGPPDGPLVLLLHGFPEYWGGWKRQIPALVQAGYRVWAPDQRGYNLSDKPKGIAAYNLDELAQDVVGLMDAAGADQARVVGHDWGAAVAWWLGVKHRERLHKLAILNVPHPAVMRRYMRQHLSQLRRSWYMFFFQIPWLPERLLARNNYEALVRTMGPAFTPDEIAGYRQAWSQPGALTGMLNWYRALFQKPPAPAQNYRVSTPLRIIWGKRDVALEWPMAERSLELCDRGELCLLEQATHWVQHDAPEQVNQLLLEHLAG